MNDFIKNQNSEKTFYYSEKDNTYGPFDQHELKNLVNENTSVSSDGSHWIKASNLPELKDYFEAKKSKKQLRLVIILFLSCLLVVIMIIILNKCNKKNPDGSEIENPIPISTFTISKTIINDTIKPLTNKPIDTTTNSLTEVINKQDKVKKKAPTPTTPTNPPDQKTCEILLAEYQSLISKIPTEHNTEFFKLCNRKAQIEIDLANKKCDIDKKIKQKLEQKCQ